VSCEVNGKMEEVVTTFKSNVSGDESRIHMESEYQNITWILRKNSDGNYKVERFYGISKK
jgi:hypothetical protein